MVSHSPEAFRCKKLPVNKACGENGIPIGDLTGWIERAVIERLTSRKFWTERERMIRAHQCALTQADLEDPEVSSPRWTRLLKMSVTVCSHVSRRRRSTP